LIWLYSLPSEKVPAPPSPNCTFDSGLSTFLRHRPQVSCVRSRTALPRSRTIGRKPLCASTSAAKMPAGPKPTMIGRVASAPVPPDELVAHVRRRLQPCGRRQNGEHPRLVGQRDVDAVDEHRRARLAGIVAAPENAQLAPNVGRRQRRGGRRPPRGSAEPADGRSGGGFR
jgi:hypothetical protein